LQEDLPRKGHWQQSRAASISAHARSDSSGDTIVVWKLDRLARSTRDLLETMETIREAGGRFRSLSEPWADTTTHAGKMIMTIFAGIAEFERDLIRERTGAGREAARKSRSSWLGGLF
jgi:DNA invertase Pin-like site-specific DNA recombinase